MQLIVKLGVIMERKIDSLSEFAAVPAKEKFAYFFGEMCSQSLFYYLVLTLSIYFFTDVMHINAAIIGTVVIVSRIFDLFTDLLIGTLVDRTKSKFGKARAWVIFMTIPYAVSMLLLYCVPASWSSAAQIAYVIITYNLAVTVCYTFENIPWGTLSTLMSRDRVQRTQLSSMRMVGSPLACALGIGIALPAIHSLGGTQHDWITVMSVFAVVGIVVNFVCAFTIKERVKTETAPEKNKLDLPSTLSNKYFWACVIIIGLYNAYVTVFSTFVPYYSTYILSGTMDTTVLNYMQFGTMAVMALVSFWLCKKMDTITMVRIGMVIAIVGQIIGIIDPSSLTVQLICALVRSIGWGMFAAIIHSLVGDAVDYGYWRTGHKAPGTTYASQGMGNKLGVLIGSGVTTLILGLSGYDGSQAVQVQSALNTIKGVYLWLPLIFAVIILVIMTFYKLNKKNFDKIIVALDNNQFHPKAKYAPEGSGRSDIIC